MPRRDISSVTAARMASTVSAGRLFAAETTGRARGASCCPARRGEKGGRQREGGRRARASPPGPAYSSQSRSFSFLGRYSSVMKLIPRRDRASSSNLRPLRTISWISRCQWAFLNHG